MYLPPSISSYNYRGIIVLTLVLLLVSAQAQQLVYFTNLTSREGLSSNITNSIVQDKHGFIWIGTQEGLCRYDGFKMTVFQHDNTPNALSSNNISTLLYDEDYIWIGTWDGLNRINIHTFEISQVITENQSGAIRALHKDHNGNIWIGTSRGLQIYNKDSGEYQLYNTSNSDLSHNTIRSFYQAANGDMWIGTYDGLNRFSHGKISIFNLKGNYKPLLENNLVVYIQPFLPENDTLLWIGTETGLARFDTRTGQYTLYNTANTQLSNEVIKCIYHQNDTLLWLGTDFGLNLFNTRTQSVQTHYHDPLIDHTIASNVIWEIFEDHQKRLWLITSNGVSITDKKEPYYQFHELYFSTEPTRIGNQVKDILVSSAGHLWLATIHGVVKIDALTGEKETFSTTTSLPGRILLNNVYALMEDEQGMILIGTAGGINIWDPHRKIMYAITSKRENGLLSNYISGFASDPEGNLWVTAWEGGLFKVDRNNPDPGKWHFSLVDPNGDGRLLATQHKLYYGSNNQFWEIDPVAQNTTTLNIITEALHNKQISAVMAARDGTLWLGTLQELIRYFPAKDSLHTMAVHTGRPHKIINLQEDHQGNIWATTPDAIVSIDAQTLEQTLIPINKNSPLKGFYHYCSGTTPDGNILFGGDNGFIEIDPAGINTSEYVPEVFITGLFINNEQIHPADSLTTGQKDIAFTEFLTLKYNQNSITFEFSTLDYLFPEFVQFQYRLLPTQEKWTLTSGEKNFAVFANLKTGDYSFEVKGSNRYGIWSEIQTLQISIKPSIWLSKGFLLLYVVLAVAITLYAYRVYSNRRRLRNELQFIKLEKQHSEALYQAKIRFFTNISHEFRTPLSLILPPIQELLKSSTGGETQEKLLKLANRNAQRLYKLVNQLLDFRKIEAEKLELATSPLELISFCREIFNSFDDMAARNEIAYSFNSNVDELFLEADREKIETIIFNLLSNAFKYTQYDGKISLSIFTKEQPEDSYQVAISVKDNGIGISEEEQQHIFKEFYQTAESRSLKKGSGIGLTLAQEYARLHKGSIKVNSRPAKGSEFVLVLPLTRGWHDNKVYTQTITKPKTAPSKEDTVENLSLAKSILVVDDNEDILEFIEMNLKDQYQITLARNGEQGLQMLEKIQPQLVISDIMMPVMDGIEFCEKIKGNKATMHIPVILLTARSLDMHKTEGINKGADLYITKPFDIDYLKSSIVGIFRREEQMAAYIKTQLAINPDQGKDTSKNQDELFLKKVMSCIENNISNPDLSVEMLGTALGMSATHLYRKLKERTGFSTKEIIMNYRMQKAARMLENNEGNVSEIMYAVGFSSLSGFSRSFKAKFGVAPTAYGENGKRY